MILLLWSDLLSSVLQTGECWLSQRWNCSKLLIARPQKNAKGKVYLLMEKRKEVVLGTKLWMQYGFHWWSQKEFSSAVFNSHLLTDEEFGTVMKYYSNEFRSPLAFWDIPRRKKKHPTTQTFLVLRGNRQRATARTPIGVLWNYLRKSAFSLQRVNYSSLPKILRGYSGLQFSVDKPFPI